MARPPARTSGRARPVRQEIQRSAPRPARGGQPGRGSAIGAGQGRSSIGLVAALIMFALIAGRLVWLQGVRGDEYAAEAISQRTITTSLPAARGRILDRNGETLAASVDARTVYGEPRTIAQSRCRPPAGKPCDPAGIAARLAPELGLAAEEVAQKLALVPKRTGEECSQESLDGCRGYVVLARGLEAEHGNAIRDLQLVGIGVLREPRRLHPGQDLAANVVGFTSVEGAGVAGIEAQYETVLAGVRGKQTAEVDGDGRIIPNGRSTTLPPRAGNDVQLTLQRDIQWYAQKVLAATVTESDAESATATVMDVTTGEVLALASVPTFDADEPGKADASLRGNRAVTDVFEPGSTGKVITAAAALEEGVLAPDSVLAVPDRIRIANKNFKDSHDHPVEQMTFTGVIVESSNVGTIMAAQKVGGPKLHEMLKRFGIGARTGIELPAESRGILRNESDWSGTDYGTHPIGQGYSVNGVQMASVYATVANGGVRVQPTILKATADDRGNIVAAPPPERRRVVSETVADQLRAMLEGVTNEGGTAQTAAIPGYRVAGKTGTAQRAVNGGYSGYTASFVGFAPADAPRLVVSVSVQNPRNGYYGGAVAGPVFRDVMSFALRALAIPPTGAPSPKLKLRAE